jgi:medium-chain acyl-[acyl-carrier-protein] hydrolase
MTAQQSPWVLRFEPRPQAALRLFCFTHAGGSPFMYSPWLPLLPPSVELCAVLLPGRERRLAEAPFTRMEPLLEALVPALLPHLHPPFAFFGHSLGALVAFEVARALRRQGAPAPARLLASGRSAPRFTPQETHLALLPDAEFIAQLGKRYNGIPPQILKEPELMRLFLPVLRADIQVAAFYNYVPEPPLDVPISAFGGLQDVGVSAERLEAWGEQTSASFESRLFPGDHFYIQPQRIPLVAAVTAALRRDVSHW